MSNAMDICPVGAELFDVDGRADTTKLLVAFRNCANVPNKTLIQLFIKYYYEVKTEIVLCKH
jgi:hypothetical protein